MRINAVLLLILLLTAVCLTINPLQATDSQVWETKSSMHTARASLGVAVVNGNIYAIGGVIEPPSYVTCSGANEKYDPKSNQWTIKTSMPTPRASFATAVVEGKIYCIGGTTGLKDGQVVTSSVNEVYDPKTDTWSTKTAMPTPRVGVSAGVVDGKIYVVGGDSNVTEVYDPATDTWNTKAAMPVKPGLRWIWSCTSAVVDDKIHVFGAFPYNASHQVYDPQNDRWSFEAPLVQGYLLAQATVTGSSGAIWVFGVDSTWWDAGPPNFTSLTYDSSGCWRVSSLMNTPRVNSALATVEDSVYVIGGSIVMIENKAHPTALIEKYLPQKDRPTDNQPPKIVLLSPQNEVYTTAVAVEFAVNKPASSILVGVDGQSLVTVLGNTTLSFDPGVHNISVYLFDCFGNLGASNTVSFTVSDGAFFSSSLLWLFAGAVVLLVSVVLAWTYFGKRKANAP